MLQLSYDNKSNRRNLSAINTVSQTMKYRQAIIKYSQIYELTKTINRYKANRQYVYRWLKRYDRSIQSLDDKSHDVKFVPAPCIVGAAEDEKYYQYTANPLNVFL